MKRRTTVALLVCFVLVVLLVMVLRTRKSAYTVQTLTNDGSVQAGIALCNTITDPIAQNACFTNVSVQYMTSSCPYLSADAVPSTDPNYAAWQEFQTSNTLIHDAYVSPSGSGLGILASINVTVPAGPTVPPSLHFSISLPGGGDVDVDKYSRSGPAYFPDQPGIIINPNVGPIFPIVLPWTSTPVQVGQTVPGDILPGGPANVTARVLFVGPYTKPDEVYLPEIGRAHV